jgi:hypothetical protein
LIGLDLSQLGTVGSVCEIKFHITDNTFSIVQRATEQSKKEIFRGYDEAETPSVFQTGLSDCVYFFFRCSCHLLIWDSD